MKHYPEIPRSTGTGFREFDAYVFDKLDGSNLRWEWSRKQGWYKHGTLTRLFDASDEIFGVALDIFESELAEPLERVARDSRWERVVVFTEFSGSGSFAGLHVPTDMKQLDVIDVAPHRQGILGPKEFLAVVEAAKVPHAQLLGRQRWTRGYVERVWNGDVEGVTFEGVVGKAGTRHELVMAKAKTKAWVDRVIARYGEEAGRKIVES